VPAFDLSSPPVALGSAAAAGFAAGILPIGIAEALAVAIGVVLPVELAIAMWVVYTIAHVAAKTPWYWLGAHSDRVMHPWAKRHIARSRAFLAARPSYGTGVLALSALLSVPPFHLSSIAAGITHIPFGRFVAICLSGRLVRFGVLAAAPALIRAWWG
jgi:membrane protein YqaA with SNARE-associated domain